MYRVNQCGALGTFSICSLHQHNDALLGRGETPRFLVAIIALSIAAGGGVGLPRTHGRTALVRSLLSRSPSSSARFMIARRHHDHRLQMRRRRRTLRTRHAHHRRKERGRPQPTQSILGLALSVGEDPANRSAHIKGSRKHSFIRPFGGDRDRGHGQPRSLGPDHREK